MMKTALVFLDKESRVIDYVAPLDIESNVLGKAIDIVNHLALTINFLSKQMNWGTISSFSIKLDSLEIIVYQRENGFIVVIKST